MFRALFFFLKNLKKNEKKVWKWAKIDEIQTQFKENINLSDEVINYIASESKTNIRELIGVLNRVIAFSRVHNKILTISDCKNILKDVFNQIRVITVDKIQNIVSYHFIYSFKLECILLEMMPYAEK